MDANITQKIADALKLNGYRMFRVVADGVGVVVTMAHTDPVAARKARSLITSIVPAYVSVTVR